MDTGVMLLKNTQWMRSFWAQATAAFKDQARMAKARTRVPIQGVNIDSS